jgi:hypothetical protein
MKKLVCGIAATAVGLVAACGGNVVVDGSTLGTGGTPGTSSTASGGAPGAGGTTTQNGNGAGGANCSDLPKSLTQCGVSGMTSTGSTSCVITYCEDQGITWSAKCQGTACQCVRNGEELCTCALDGTGDICSGTPDCCYHD